MGLFRKNKPQAEYPFPEAPDTAVFTCIHVLSGSEPIRYVTHDEDDGAWQFLCGGEHEEADARVASLHSIWKPDPSVGKLAGMSLGSYAWRTKAAASWNIRRTRSD